MDTLKDFRISHENSGTQGCILQVCRARLCHFERFWHRPGIQEPWDLGVQRCFVLVSHFYVHLVWTCFFYYAKHTSKKHGMWCYHYNSVIWQEKTKKHAAVDQLSCSICRLWNPNQSSWIRARRHVAYGVLWNQTSRADFVEYIDCYCWITYHVTVPCNLNGCERNESNIHLQLGTKQGLCRKKSDCFLTIRQSGQLCGFLRFQKAAVFYKESDWQHHNMVYCKSAMHFDVIFSKLRVTQRPF